ncbi:hypothetical protein JZ785_18750 [Alicyclobacillus curvatus]|jgi:hypothetical protein|nr:hypothetical protein JZ785_18750 [Alicyclobacillus curvatus]
MKMDSANILEMDRRFLLDFYSLGVWAHQFTAVALYHEAQRVPSDRSIAVDDKPRVQTVLRAKILSEVAASMETLGRLCFAVGTRGRSGIAAHFVNMRFNRATTFYKSLFTSETIEELMKLPNRHKIGKDVELPWVVEFFETLQQRLPSIAGAYLDQQDAPITGNKLGRAYNAIKHGSHIVNNVQELSPVPVDMSLGNVPILTRWPLHSEEISDETMILISRSMSEEAVNEDLAIIKEVCIIMNNLSQILIRMIDKKALAYDANDEYLDLK